MRVSRKNIFLPQCILLIASRLKYNNHKVWFWLACFHKYKVPLSCPLLSLYNVNFIIYLTHFDFSCRWTLGIWKILPEKYWKAILAFLVFRWDCIETSVQAVFWILLFPNFLKTTCNSVCHNTVTRKSNGHITHKDSYETKWVQSRQTCSFRR